MKYTPHPYQQQATKFIQNHDHAAIILGMGMGKTVITLTAINNLIYDQFKVARALIIAPIRVAKDTWPQETTKWEHLAGLAMNTMIGTPTQRRQSLHTPGDVWTINRENIDWLVNEVGGKWPFDMVVIDELSSFKNHQSKRFKALKKVRPHIKRIVGLTGTPAPNSLMDLWAQYRLLDGGQRLYPTIGAYRDHYFTPGRRNGHVIYDWKLREGAEEQIYEAIEDITLSMRTTDHLQLPEVTYTTHQVTMTNKQHQAYNRFKKDMIATLADGNIIDAANAATLSGKLQQLASGAIYTGDSTSYTTIHTAKMDALAHIINEAEEQSVLVAYWFQHEKDRILNQHPQARLLSTSQDFTDWNAGRIPIGLIHPASAGHGLNLQAGGHILVWVTTPWSLELYEQTNARLHRQGQQHPVTIIHITTKDTIDTQVGKALATKATTQDALINAVKAQL